LTGAAALAKYKEALTINREDGGVLERMQRVSRNK
jgi:hypothetical protein